MSAMETWLAAVLDDEQRHRFDELVRYLGFAAVVLLAAGVLWILGFLGCAFRFSWPFIVLGVLLCVGLLGASYVYANLLLTGAGFAGLLLLLTAARMVRTLFKTASIRPGYATRTDPVRMLVSREDRRDPSR